MQSHPGTRLRQNLKDAPILPFIGVYDAFSAIIAGKNHHHLFISGYGFAASYYGAPDVGLITWSDMLAFVERLRSILPDHLLLVDIDDGYGDSVVTAHVVRQLELAGAAGIILEDQKRPRRCGHVEGKQLLSMEDYLEKLQKILGHRDALFVVARTDATDEDEILTRAIAYEQAGADAILADGIKDLAILARLKAHITVPLGFNQIAGGKSPAVTLSELQAAGVSLVNYSTPCLFAAQMAIETALTQLAQQDGKLGDRGLMECNQVLQEAFNQSLANPTISS